MFENYNKYNRPVLKESQAVLVEFDYQLIRIIDVVRRISLRSSCVLINSIGGKLFPNVAFSGILITTVHSAPEPCFRRFFPFKERPRKKANCSFSS